MECLRSRIAKMESIFAEAYAFVNNLYPNTFELRKRAFAEAVVYAKTGLVLSQMSCGNGLRFHMLKKYIDKNHKGHQDESIAYFYDKLRSLAFDPLNREFALSVYNHNGEYLEKDPQDAEALENIINQTQSLG